MDSDQRVRWHSDAIDSLSIRKFAYLDIRISYANIEEEKIAVHFQFSARSSFLSINFSNLLYDELCLFQSAPLLRSTHSPSSFESVHALRERVPMLIDAARDAFVLECMCTIEKLSVHDGSTRKLFF